MRRVALVLDSLREVASLASSFDIMWINDSAENRAFEADLKARAGSVDITWFQRPTGSDDDVIRCMAEMIEDHHGPYASSPPWQELVVYGAIDGSALEHAFAGEEEFVVDSAKTIVRRKDSGFVSN